jgi:hypothetical protein
MFFVKVRTAFAVLVATSFATLCVPAAFAQDGEDSFIEACIGGDRVLRVREEGALRCETGERDVRLSLWEPEEPEEEEEEEETVTQLKAPFEVVDKAGAVIFRVNEDEGGYARGAYVQRGGERVIGLGAPDTGAWILLNDNDGATPLALLSKEDDGGKLELNRSGGSSANMGVSSIGPYLVLSPDGSIPGVAINASTELGGNLQLAGADGEALAHLGLGDAGNPALRIYDGGKQLAGIGIDDMGNGLVRVGDAARVELVSGAEGGTVIVSNGAGNTAAIVASTRDGNGLFQIYGAGGEATGSLAQGANGGMLQLNNNAGVPMVEAGNNGSAGVVRAGPAAAPVGLTIPSFIQGRAN